MMPNNGTLMKLAEDPVDEIQEAAYRAAASTFVKEAKALLISRTELRKDIMNLLENDSVIIDAILGFVMAAVLEVLPTPNLAETRKRLAYNLWVGFYQGVEERFLSIVFRFVPDLVSLVENAERNAKLASDLQGPDGSPEADGADSHEPEMSANKK